VSRRIRPGPVPPGKQFVAIDVECAPCKAGGLHRRIGRFGRYTYPGAGREPWEEGWGKHGQRLRPEWTPGPGGGETVHLMCDSGHHRPVRKERIITELDSVPPRPGGWRVKRVAL
jgi:hypothetical protein